LIAAVQLADLTALQGQLPQAAELYQRAIERAKQSGQLPQMISMVDASWGRLLYEWNDLDRAARVLTDCVDLGRHWASSDMTLTGLVFLAHVKHAQGEVAAAREIMRQAEEVMHEQMISPPTVTVAKAYQARLWLKQNDIEAAQQWIREYQARRSQPTSIFLHEIEELTLARSCMAQGHFDQAQAVLDPILATARAIGRVAILIEAQVLRAVVDEARGNSTEALKAIQEALAQAEPGGYLRTFVDAGTTLKTLLIKVAPRLPYAEKVLTAFGQKQPTSRSNVRSAALVEPLSDRELQVLRLIAEGLSNQEIATQLVVAPSTIKTHINNIYGKLATQSRTQGVARARELNLL
jgi:LuxR family maltose regulon positive regulatory protein